MPNPRSVLSPDLIAAIESGACILTPDQRYAHRLRLLYANQAVSAGRRAWATPAIYSFDQFVARLWRAQPYSANERVLSSEQSQLLWNRIVATSNWSELLLSPQAAAIAAFRSWERLQAWRIDERILKEHAASDNHEARALVEWSERFQDRCRQQSWLPIAKVPERLLAGPLVSQLAHAVIVPGEELLPIQAALVDHLVAQGVRCDSLAGAQKAGVVNFIACESEENELQSAALWARAQLESGLRSIAVMVPNLDEQMPRVRRVFAEVFAQTTRTLMPGVHASSDRSRQEASFSIAGYRLLADFPVARAALDLLQLGVGRVNGSLAGAILRNPFLTGGDSERAQRALCDAYLRGTAREHYDYASLQSVAVNCPTLGEALRAALAIRLHLSGRALPSLLAEHFIELWRVFGWPGEQTLDSDEQQIVARVQACVAEFGALDELLGPLSFAAGVREFEQWMRNTSFEPRSLPAPIAILNVQAAEGLQFEALWVAGMEETRWPPLATPDAFIPIELQKRAGMPQADSHLAHRHARKRFLGLQGAADTVVFSWPRWDEDVEVLPSPWLRELTPLVSETPHYAGYAARIFTAKPKLEVVEERHAPALTFDRVRGGTRIFELQSNCPFRAFAELRLAARRLDEIVPSIDARERGMLVHAALADVWQTLGGSDGLHSRTNEQLETLVRTALAQHSGKLLIGASSHRVRMIQIEQELAAERILALLELDRQRAPFRVVGQPETSERASIGKLSFEMRLDRIDELLGEGAGGKVIVDYKTGDRLSVRSWFRERPDQPQLPLYAATHAESLAAVAFATVSAQGAAYQGVARNDEILPGVKAFNSKVLPLPYAEWEGLLAFWQANIARLANDFAEGDARVDPLPAACRYCHLSALCRIHEGIVPLDGEGEES